MPQPLDVSRVREDFPVLTRQWNGVPIAYLDNAATALKPKPVIDAVMRYMAHSTANIHRANHLLSQEASIAFEAARDKAAEFFNVYTDCVIFVRGATEGINLVASGLRLDRGDNVVGTLLEHHSNILPWSSRCEYRAAPLDEAGLPNIEAAARCIDERTRLLAVTQCSNVTGVCPDISAWVELARAHDLPILVDGAQGVLHESCDVTALDIDFYVVSGHKLCGPTGSGCLLGKRERLKGLDVAHLGGGAVERVHDDFTYVLRELPWRLESGTPDIAAVLGLGAALEYLQACDLDSLRSHNHALAARLYERVSAIPALRILSPKQTERPRAPIVSFTYEPMKADLFSRVLNDSYGILTRHGHQCTHPLHHHLEVPGSVRASLQFYNTFDEIDRLGEALELVTSMPRAAKPAAKPAHPAADTRDR